MDLQAEEVKGWVRQRWKCCPGTARVNHGASASCRAVVQGNRQPVGAGSEGGLDEPGSAKGLSSCRGQRRGRCLGEE